MWTFNDIKIMACWKCFDLKLYGKVSGSSWRLFLLTNEIFLPPSLTFAIPDNSPHTSNHEMRPNLEPLSFYDPPFLSLRPFVMFAPIPAFFTLLLAHIWPLHSSSLFHFTLLSKLITKHISLSLSLGFYTFKYWSNVATPFNSYGMPCVTTEI